MKLNTQDHILKILRKSEFGIEIQPEETTDILSPTAFIKASNMFYFTLDIESTPFETGLSNDNNNVINQTWEVCNYYQDKTFFKNNPLIKHIMEFEFWDNFGEYPKKENLHIPMEFILKGLTNLNSKRVRKFDRKTLSKTLIFNDFFSKYPRVLKGLREYS